MPYMMIERYLSGPEPVDVWFERWSDLVSFEVYPVITSAEAAARAGTDRTSEPTAPVRQSRE
jgi:hypothetical protein